MQIIQSEAEDSFKKINSKTGIHEKQPSLQDHFAV